VDPALAAVLEIAHDRGVAHSTERYRFAIEAVLVERVGDAHDLERDGIARRLVDRAVHGAHAAGAELLHDPVPGEPIPGAQGGDGIHSRAQLAPRSIEVGRNQNPGVDAPRDPTSPDAVDRAIVDGLGAEPPQPELTVARPHQELALARVEPRRRFQRRIGRVRQGERLDRRERRDIPQLRRTVGAAVTMNRPSAARQP
jgi:hypothetical protein